VHPRKELKILFRKTRVSQTMTLPLDFPINHQQLWK
jgi:hypothetical protein